MELIDILDERGNKTGEVATIEELHKSGKWHKVVGLIIYDTNKNILMQQRATHEKIDPGKWDISSAGHVNSKETEIEAIKRETLEELGIIIEENKLKHFFSYKKEVCNQKVNKKHLEDIFIIKMDNINIKNLNIQKEEVEQVKWLTINEIKELIKNNQVKTRDKMYDLLFKYLK